MATATETENKAIIDACADLGVNPDQIDRITLTPTRGLDGLDWFFEVTVHGGRNVSGFLATDGSPQSVSLVPDDDPFEGL